MYYFSTPCRDPIPENLSVASPDLSLSLMVCDLCPAYNQLLLQKSIHEKYLSCVLLLVEGDVRCHVYYPTTANTGNDNSEAPLVE
jgi:hypothetical protein